MSGGDDPPSYDALLEAGAITDENLGAWQQSLSSSEMALE